MNRSPAIAIGISTRDKWRVPHICLVLADVGFHRAGPAAFLLQRIPKIHARFSRDV